LARANSDMTPLDYHALASSQDQDAELQDILKNGSALRLEPVHIPGTDVSIYCDTSIPQPRPFITIDGRYLTPSMASAIPGPTPPSSWCPSGLCGREWGKTAAYGHTCVHPANDPR
jgi:hypothetical protein